MYRALKVETEAEGATADEISFLVQSASRMGLPTFLKIGGVEARTDINLARSLQIPGLVAPMVESGFGAEKFLDATSGLGFDWLALTIESKTAVEKLSEILKVAAGRISGMTIGRGDLADSIGLKGREDSHEVIAVVDRTARSIRDAGFFVTIGGNMLPSSALVLEKYRIPHDYLETRRFVIRSASDGENWGTRAADQIREALRTEISLSAMFSQRFETILGRGVERRKTLVDRLTR